MYFRAWNRVKASKIGQVLPFFALAKIICANLFNLWKKCSASAEKLVKIRAIRG
jgi:hypothetical protein